MSVTTRRGFISNDGLRMEFLRRQELGWVTAATVARALGWMSGSGHPDANRVRRALGLQECKTHGRAYMQRNIREALAVRVAEAMGADPWECDF